VKAGSSPPRVTVGIPFFNEEEHLGAAIQSILDQTIEDVEVLLLDDGSTDRSLAIARSFDDPRVVVLSDGHQRCLPARLNEITRGARADLVARMDADDLAHPRRLALQLDMLERNPSWDAVGTWTASVDDDGEILGVNEAGSLLGSPRTALEHGLMSHATMLARRRWLRANPYDERLTRAEDRDLWCRTVRTSSFAVVPLPLYVIRVFHREAAFLANYLESQRQNRILFLRHGPGSVGVAGTTANRRRTSARS
jgi:glycosyltransferase involved in cell wall biosynthesis